MTIEPKWVLDLGCGTGEWMTALKTHYPKATVVGVDLSNEMLTYAQKHHAPIHLIQSRARVLPLASHSVDLISAHLLLPWIVDIKSLLQECKRVLKPNGLFLCTALGPDTLREIKATHQDYIVPNLIDMHDLGDLLLEAGLKDPVMEANTCTAVYHKKTTLLKEFIASGLLGKDTPIDQSLSSLEITLEVIYGHAFAPSTLEQKTRPGEISISLQSLKKSLQHQTK